MLPFLSPSLPEGGRFRLSPEHDRETPKHTIRKRTNRRVSKIRRRFSCTAAMIEMKIIILRVGNILDSKRHWPTGIYMAEGAFVHRCRRAERECTKTLLAPLRREIIELQDGQKDKEAPLGPALVRWHWPARQMPPSHDLTPHAHSCHDLNFGAQFTAALKL